MTTQWWEFLSPLSVSSYCDNLSLKRIHEQWTPIIIDIRIRDAIFWCDIWNQMYPYYFENINHANVFSVEAKRAEEDGSNTIFIWYDYYIVLYDYYILYCYFVPAMIWLLYCITMLYQQCFKLSITMAKTNNRQFCSATCTLRTSEVMPSRTDNHKRVLHNFIKSAYLLLAVANN